MMTALLILHGLCAVALLGAITHQALAASVKRGEVRGRSFVARFRATDAAAYATPVAVIFMAVMLVFLSFLMRRRELEPPTATS